jgi:hypothetical protein
MPVRTGINKNHEKYYSVVTEVSNRMNRIKNCFDTHCSVCNEEDSEFVDLKTCNDCKAYMYYCSRECQTVHCKDGGNHNKAECNNEIS